MAFGEKLYEKIIALSTLSIIMGFRALPNKVSIMYIQNAYLAMYRFQLWTSKLVRICI